MKMDDTGPVVKDLVLIGGGHTHVFILKMMGMNKLPGVRVTLVAKEVSTPYSGMLPGHVAGHYTWDECHVDLRPLCTFAGHRLIHDEATSIDTVNKRVVLRGRPPIPYDALSIDIGITPGYNSTGAGAIQGAANFTTPVKPIYGFSARWEALLERVMTTTTATRVVVVGGGAGGVELALAMQHRRGQGRHCFTPTHCLLHLTHLYAVCSHRNQFIHRTLLRQRRCRNISRARPCAPAARRAG